MAQTASPLNNVQSAEDSLRNELKEYETSGCAEPHVPGQVAIADETRQLISDALASMAEDIARRASNDPSDEKLERSLKNFADCYAKIERINLAKARFVWDMEKAQRRAGVSPGCSSADKRECGGSADAPPASCSQNGAAATDNSRDGCSTTETEKPLVVPPSGGCERSRACGETKRNRRDIKPPTRAQRRAAMQAEALKQAEDAKLPLPSTYEIAREVLEDEPEFAEFLQKYLSGKWQPPPKHEDMVAGKFNWVYRAPPGPPAVNKFANIFPLKTRSSSSTGVPPASGNPDSDTETDCLQDGSSTPKYRKPTKVEIYKAVEEHFPDFLTYHTEKLIDNPYSKEEFAALYGHWHAKYIAKYGGEPVSPENFPEQAKSCQKGPGRIPQTNILERQAQAAANVSGTLRVP
jgi:hypothetical protein